VTLKRGKNIKYLPYAFTEHGAIMADTMVGHFNFTLTQTLSLKGEGIIIISSPLRGED
jgi:hypothetical protein